MSTYSAMQPGNDRTKRARRIFFYGERGQRWWWLFLATTNDVGESGVGSTLETPPSNKYIRSRILNIFIFVGLYYTARAEVTELHGRRIGI